MVSGVPGKKPPNNDERDKYPQADLGGRGFPIRRKERPTFGDEGKGNLCRIIGRGDHEEGGHKNQRGKQGNSICSRRTHEDEVESGRLTYHMS